MTEIADEKDREKLRQGLNNRTASYITKNDAMSAISAEDQQVFKSKFVQRYYSILYNDIKDTLKNPAAIDDVPHFGPPKVQRTVSASGTNEIILEVSSDSVQQKRANTSLNSSVHMRRQAAELMRVKIEQQTQNLNLTIEEEQSYDFSQDAQKKETFGGKQVRPEPVWS